MQIRVHMLAFGKKDEVRVVDIPDEFILAEAFRLGQNDFQPKPVSVGDVIELPDKTLHLVQPVGFDRIDEIALQRYRERKFPGTSR